MFIRRAQLAKDRDAGAPVSPLQELVSTRKRQPRAQKIKPQSSETPAPSQPEAELSFAGLSLGSDDEPPSAPPRAEAALQIPIGESHVEPLSPLPQAEAALEKSHVEPLSSLPQAEAALETLSAESHVEPLLPTTLSVAASSVPVDDPQLSHEHPLPQRTCEVVIAVPSETVHEFITHFRSCEWENTPPYIYKASETVVNALIAQKVPSRIYKPSSPKRKYSEVEEAQPLEDSPPKRQRIEFPNRADGRRKPNRLWDIKMREVRKQREQQQAQRQREIEERNEENRRHAAKLASIQVGSDDDNEPSPPNSPSMTAQDQAQTHAAITSSQTQIAQTTTDISTTELPQIPITQGVVTASIQTAAEPLATPQPTRRWGLGGLTQSVSRLLFRNPRSVDTPVAPASAPHAPSQLELTVSGGPSVESAAPEPVLDAEAEMEAARREMYPDSTFPHYPLPPLPPLPPLTATQPLTEAAPAGLNVARSSRRARRDRDKSGAESAASGAENNALVRTNVNDDSDGDAPVEPHFDEELFRKAIDEQRAQDLKELEKNLRKHKRKLDFEFKKKQEMIDQEIEEKVRAQLADKSKKRRRASPEIIPNPPGSSYGMDPDYFVVSSDEDDVPDTPTKRPSKRQRSEPTLLTPPRRQPKLIGNPKSARPYTGSMFATDPPPPENIFDPTTHRRGGFLPKLDKDTVRKAEVWDANPRLSTIPEAHRNYAGSFIVPASPESSSDEESNASTTPTGSPSKTVAPDTGSSEKPSGSWTQPPPRAPVPSPAALPKQPTQHSPTQPDLLAKAREQANRFAPSRPSGLRNASRVSLSTIASESDREEDQADNVPAPTPATSKTAATFALLTEPAKISPTKKASNTGDSSNVTIESTSKSSEGSTALASRPDTGSITITRSNVDSPSMTRPDAGSPTIARPRAGFLSTTAPDENLSNITHSEANALIPSDPGPDSPDEDALTLESLQRPSLSVKAKVIPCNPWDPETYKSVAAAMESLDPLVRVILKGMKDQFHAPNFDDFSWACDSAHSDPTLNVNDALAQVARVTGPIDPEVEAAIRALRREDLAKFNFSEYILAATASDTDAPAAESADDARLIKQALAENWTEEAKQNACDLFDAAMLQYEEWKEVNPGQTFDDYWDSLQEQTVN